MPEPTLEQLFKTIEGLDTKLNTYMASGIKVGQEEDEKKKMEAKKAEDEKKEKDKMEAKKAKYDAAIKSAMDEKDHDKKMAAIKAAMDEYDDKHEAFGKPGEHKATDEEKEKEAQIASIINDKKTSLIKQILSANRIGNPNGLKEVEARLKTASITDIQKEFDTIMPFIANTTNQNIPQTQEKFIPYFGSTTPADIDNSQLNANSPDSDFNKLTTKELMELGQ